MSNDQSQKTSGIGGWLSRILGSLFFIAVLLLFLGIAALVLGFSATIVGRIIAQGSGLTVFEATLITVIVGIAVVYFLIDKPRFSYPWDSLARDEDDEDWEDDEEWAEDDAADYVPPAKTINAVKPPPGRNDLCPCGSGRKYKNCHGR